MPREASKRGRNERRRGLRERLALALAVAMIVGGALAGGASAAESVEGGNSFNELSQKAQQETTTAETTGTETTGTEAEVHNTSKTVFIGIGAAIVLLLAIAFVIVRDARRVAPAGAEEFGEGKPGRNTAVQRRNRRKKARAAKAARKKHR